MMMAMQMPFAGGFVKAFSVNAPADAFMSTVTLVNGGVFIIAKLSAVLGISNFAGITVMIVGGHNLFSPLRFVQYHQKIFKRRQHFRRWLLQALWLHWAGSARLKVFGRA